MHIIPMHTYERASFTAGTRRPHAAFPITILRFIFIHFPISNRSSQVFLRCKYFPYRVVATSASQKFGVLHAPFPDRSPIVLEITTVMRVFCKCHRYCVYGRCWVFRRDDVYHRCFQLISPPVIPTS